MIFEKRVEIFVHKRKMGLHLLVCLTFVSLGIWIVTDSSSQYRLFGFIPISNLLLGSIIIFLFAFIGYALIRKFMRKSPVLVLDEVGIFDCTTQSSGIDIQWSGIMYAQMIKVVNQPFVMIELHDPEAFIDQVSNGIKKKVARMNYNKYGSPLMISTNGLTVKSEELLNMIEAHLKKA